MRLIFLAFSLVSFILYRAEKIHPGGPDKWKDLSAAISTPSDSFKLSKTRRDRDSVYSYHPFMISKPESRSIGLFYKMTLSYNEK